MSNASGGNARSNKLETVDCEKSDISPASGGNEPELMQTFGEASAMNSLCVKLLFRAKSLSRFVRF